MRINRSGFRYSSNDNEEQERIHLLSPTYEDFPSLPVVRFRSFLNWLLTEHAWDNFWRAIVGEFVGTFLLMYIGMGAIYAQDELLYVALSWAAIIPILITVFGKISGAFFNPAITLVFLVLGDVKPIKALFCILAQLLGATVACVFQLYIYPMDTRIPYEKGCTTISGSVYRELANEIGTTFAQVFLILSLTRNQGGSEPKFPHNLIASVGIGTIIFSLIIMGAPISGASMNPARSFAPALIAGFWDNQWVYWIGPTTGALLGLILWHLFVKSPDRESSITSPRKSLGSNKDFP